MDEFKSAFVKCLSLYQNLPKGLSSVSLEEDSFLAVVGLLFLGLHQLEACNQADHLLP